MLKRNILVEIGEIKNRLRVSDIDFKISIVDWNYNNEFIFLYFIFFLCSTIVDGGCKEYVRCDALALKTNWKETVGKI